MFRESKSTFLSKQAYKPWVSNTWTAGYVIHGGPQVRDPWYRQIKSSVEDM